MVEGAAAKPSAETASVTVCRTIGAVFDNTYAIQPVSATLSQPSAGSQPAPSPPAEASESVSE
jgi:hypothetical protein